jgi:hypothetical protein
MSTEIRFTRFTTRNPAQLSKRFTLIGNVLDKQSGGNMLDGVAERLSVSSIDQFADLLPSLTPKQALSYGVNGHEQARVVTADHLDKAREQGGDLPVIARNRDHFTWSDGPGLMMLDYDAPAEGAALDMTQLRDALATTCPPLETAPAIWRPSASSCIYSSDGAELRGVAGQRLYIPVLEAADIPRAGQVLFDRLWLAGYGRYELSKSGSFLARTVIDASVFQPERLDFCGGAATGKGLVQRLPAPIIFNPNAPYLDTRQALPDLTAEERNRLDAMRTAMQESLKPRQQEIRAQWVESRVNDRLKKIPADQAEEARPELERVYRQAAEGGWLDPDFELTVKAKGSKSGKRITVAELLRDRKTYHEATTLDPLEPEYPEGQARYVGWLNLKARGPYLQSQAHGGTRYGLSVESDQGATPEPPPMDVKLKAAADWLESQVHSPHPDYSFTKNGAYWIKHTTDGDEYVFLANFTAEIVAETIIDDGAERKRRMDITGRLPDGPLPTATIPSGQFSAMNWVGSEWGSAAQIVPGFGLKDRLRYAIQVLSTSIRYQTLYEHSGWREIDGRWFYLSQNGVIGADGLVDDINVALPGSLADYALTLPHQPAAALRASLLMLECAPPSVSVPLFLAPYRAMISEALPGDFSLFLSGVTGSRKTEVAAILQGHFGDAWHGKHLPAAWSSTANSLERAAFLVKDAVLVVDDFCPNGTTADVAKFHKDADRLLRAQGNRAGRQRMNADGSLRPAYFPRGLIVATGEDIPRGQSLRGRLLILEFTAETVNLPNLTTLQQHANAGTLAGAAGAFCQWLAPRIPQIKQQLPERRNQLRNEINATAHSRHPDTLAGLMITAEVFAEFAAAQGVNLPLDWPAFITEALLQAGKEQQQAIAAEEPAGRFVRLIESALAAGRCHLKPMDGQPLPPSEDFTRYGWQLKTFGVGECERTDWHECGTAIGRFKHEESWGIYLDPEVSYALAQRIAEEQGHAIPLQQRSLFKALQAKDYLLSRNEPHFTIKTKLPDKSSKRFLHLRVGGLNSGNCGNCGNQGYQDNDFQSENPVPTSQNTETEVGTVGTKGFAGSHSVPTHYERFPLDKTEWEPKITPNSLLYNDSFKPVPTVPTVPTIPNIPRILAILSDAPAGMELADLIRTVGNAKGTSAAMIEMTVNRMLLSGQLGKVNGRLVINR